MLCPNSSNNYQGVYLPEKLNANISQQAVLTVSFLIFNLGVNWIAGNLLGRRTGAVLSFVLRTIFFSVILMWTLHSLITVRLLIVD